MSERLLSLREVSALTETPLGTVRRWVREERLPVERVGPLKLKRVRIRYSVLVRAFPAIAESVNL